MDREDWFNRGLEIAKKENSVSEYCRKFEIYMESSSDKDSMYFALEELGLTSYLEDDD